MQTENTLPRIPTLGDALIPVFALIVMLGGTVYVYGIDSFGPNMVSLMIAAGIAAAIGLKNRHSWKDIEEGAYFDREPYKKGDPSRGGSIFVPVELNPNESKTITLQMTLWRNMRSKGQSTWCDVTAREENSSCGGEARRK